MNLIILLGLYLSTAVICFSKADVVKVPVKDEKELTALESEIFERNKRVSSKTKCGRGTTK